MVLFFFGLHDTIFILSIRLWIPLNSLQYVSLLKFEHFTSFVDASSRAMVRLTSAISFSPVISEGDTDVD